MKIGVFIFPTSRTIQPAELAQACEARNFDALLLPEHTHIPAARTTPYPAGGELPAEYWTSHDPMIALAQAAVVTTKLKLGTGISLVVEHDPIVQAKQVATLDALSSGRFLFGVGSGWNVEEMANHGTDFKQRWAVLEERVQAMKAIWQNTEASYAGKYVNFDRILQEPKPVQRPNPPILIGGSSKRALECVARVGDGWMPIASRAGIAKGLPLLHQACERAGRDPKTLSLNAFMAPPVAGELEKLAADGIERAFFYLPSAPRDNVLGLLDQWAPLAKTW